MPAASLSISMTSSVTHSSSLLNKVSDFTFSALSHVPVSNNHFPSKSKPITPKPLRLNTQFPNLYLLSQTHLCRASSSFDFSQDSTFTEQLYRKNEEKATEPQPKVKVWARERKVRESGRVGRLYVGNLPYSMTSSQLSEIFGEAGQVVSVEVVYDRVTDRSRGFAFVTMGSVEEAKEAIRLFNSAQVGGRSVKVNFPEVPKGAEGSIMKQKIRNSYEGFIDTPNKIYVGNLGWGVTSQSLREVFAKHRGVLSAKVLYDRDSGRSRGFGFVSFESAEDSQTALDGMNGVEIEGRPLRLNVVKDSGNIAPPTVERKKDDLVDSELSSSMST